MTVAMSPQVRLANDIAAQFHHLAPQAAAEAIASHLDRFWDARMIADLLRRVRSGDGDVDPLAVAAAGLLEQRRG